MRREVLQLRQPLHPGVAGTDEHEAQVLGAQRGVLDGLGDVHAAQHLVAQGGRVRQRLQADRMLCQAGHGKRSGHRPEGDEQVVVAELELLTVDATGGQRARGRIATRHPADQEVRPAQL